MNQEQNTTEEMKHSQLIFWSLFIGTGFGLRLHQPKFILSRKYEKL
jgi:hypothetical protein